MKSICRLFLCTLIAFAVSMPIYANGNSAKNVYKFIDRTYGELSGEWWQWALSTPIPHKPGEDGYINCSDGQEGKVWFLAGTWGGPADRECLIPEGKALFFPLLNAAWMEFPGEDESIDVKRNDLAGYVSGCNMHSTIDGTPTIITSPVVRTQSPPFSIVADYWGYAINDDEVISDGYWVMVPPLKKGEHIIRFGGENCNSGFVTEATYTITVVDDFYD